MSFVEPARIFARTEYNGRPALFNLFCSREHASSGLSVSIFLETRFGKTMENSVCARWWNERRGGLTLGGVANLEQRRKCLLFCLCSNRASFSLIYSSLDTKSMFSALRDRMSQERTGRCKRRLFCFPLIIFWRMGGVEEGGGVIEVGMVDGLYICWFRGGEVRVVVFNAYSAINVKFWLLWICPSRVTLWPRWVVAVDFWFPMT